MEFFENSNALESLRSSDFDNLSAYAEVIDDFLQAGAKNINVDFFLCRLKRITNALMKSLLVMMVQAWT